MTHNPTGRYIQLSSAFAILLRVEISDCLCGKTMEITQHLRVVLSIYETAWELVTICVRNLHRTEFLTCFPPFLFFFLRFPVFHIVFAFPAGTDVFKTSSGRLKKVTRSYDQTRRRQDIWKKTFDLGRLEDVLFTSSWRRPIYNVLKTSDLWRPKDVWFKTSWRRPIYVVLETSNLERLEDVWFTMSKRGLIQDVLKMSNLRRLEDVWFLTS